MRKFALCFSHILPSLPSSIPLPSPVHSLKPFTPEIAMLWASSRCARRECCRQDLLDKLLQGGLSAEECDQVLDRLEDEGFLDEDRYARAFTHDKLEYDHWGRIKIAQHLRTKGIRRKSIDMAFDEVIVPAHYRDILHHILIRKAATLRYDATDSTERYKTYQKLVRFAASRGFEADLIFDMAEEALQYNDSLQTDDITQADDIT